MRKQNENICLFAYKKKIAINTANKLNYFHPAFYTIRQIAYSFDESH